MAGAGRWRWSTSSARHKSEENFGLLRDGLGPRDGQLVAFSTAGDDEDSALGRIRIRAHGIPGFGPAGDNPKHKIGRADGFAFHEWSLGAGDDTDDLALVKLANPASWLDESELRARKDSPSMQPWQWQRFTCGMWVAGEHSAISGKDWLACADPGSEIPADAEGVIDRDRPRLEDMTTPRSSRSGATPRVRSASTPRSSLSRREAASPSTPRTCSPPASSAPSGGLAAPSSWTPRPAASSSPSGWSARSRPQACSSTSQKAGPMCLASQRLAEAIAAHRIRHPDHEELTRHVLGASAKWVGPKWRFAKPRGKEGQKIDAVIALAMAISVIVDEESKPKPRAADRRSYERHAATRPRATKRILDREAARHSRATRW